MQDAFVITCVYSWVITSYINMMCGIISRICIDLILRIYIENDLLYSHAPLSYLLYQCLLLYLSNWFKNPMHSSKEVSACTLCYCSAAPFERYLQSKKILPVDKLINQEEGILAYKVINGTYLLNDFLNHGDVRHQIQLWNNGDLRIPLYTATQSQLCVRYRAINAWNGLSGDLRSSSSFCTFKNKLGRFYPSLT